MSTSIKHDSLNFNFEVDAKVVTFQVPNDLMFVSMHDVLLSFGFICLGASSKSYDGANEVDTYPPRIMTPVGMT